MSSRYLEDKITERWRNLYCFSDFIAKDFTRDMFNWGMNTTTKVLWFVLLRVCPLSICCSQSQRRFMTICFKLAEPLRHPSSCFSSPLFIAFPSTSIFLRWRIFVGAVGANTNTFEPRLCWKRELCSVMARIDFQFPPQWLHHFQRLRQFGLHYWGCRGP